MVKGTSSGVRLLGFESQLYHQLYDLGNLCNISVPYSFSYKMRTKLNRPYS